MKAIPDLDFAAKQIKPSSNSPSTQTPQTGATTQEHRTGKPQQKLSAKEGGSRRGSGKSAIQYIVFKLKRPNITVFLELINGK